MAKKPRTTQSDRTHRVVCNQLDRCFRTEAPNQVQISDLTYLKVAGQWRHLVIFLDLFSQKVVGWDPSDSLEASKTVRALQRALQSPRPAAGLLVHSDRKMQQSYEAFQQLLRRHALVLSMSRKGDCWDNAVAAYFFRHLIATVNEGRSFWDERQLRRVVFEYIEIHYARERKHSSNGWKTPQQYENEFAESLHQTPQPLIYFSGQGQLEMLVEILRRVGKVLEDIRKIFCLTLASWLTASKFMLLSLAFSLN